MHERVRLGVVLVLAVMPAGVWAEDTTVINFDDLTAPCELADALPLRDEYASIGVEFFGIDNNGAAVLDECSGLGLGGYSSPNFAVIDTDAVLANGGVPDSLVMVFADEAPNHVSVDVGGPAGITAMLQCTICPWAVPGCDRFDTVVLDGSLTTLEVAAIDRFQLGCEVRISGGTGPVIVDTVVLASASGSEAIPTVSLSGAVALAILVAAGALMAMRRPAG